MGRLAGRQQPSKKILAGGANAAQRFVFDADQGALGGGVMVRTYLNKFSMAGAEDARHPRASEHAGGHAS